MYPSAREEGRVREFGSGQRSGDRVRSLPGNVGYSQNPAECVKVQDSPASTKCEQNTMPELQNVEMQK